MSPGEVLRKIDQVFGRCSGVPVDDLVIVAYTEAAVGRGAHEPDQQHVGRVEILELVDEEVTAATLGRRASVGVSQQDLNRPVDLFVEVDSSRLDKSLSIRSETGSKATGVWDLILDHRRRRQAEPHRGQCVNVRQDRVGVRLTADLEHFLHEVPDPGFLEDVEPPLAPELVADPIPDAVERPDVGSSRRHEAPTSVAHFPGRLRVEREGGHRRRVRAAVVDHVAKTLGQHRVFPEPAGAITRAPPTRWPTAASWSDARSASGGSGATAVRDPASVFQRCTMPTPPGRSGGANGPPSTYRGVPSPSKMSAGPASVTPRSAKLLAAFRACHQTGSPLRAS